MPPKDPTAWMGVLISVVISMTSTTIWAYSTFVTVRERDTARATNERRMIHLEDGYEAILNGQYEIKGKVDSLIMLQGKAKH